jgi:hypothetical protein
MSSWWSFNNTPLSQQTISQFTEPLFSILKKGEFIVWLSAVEGMWCSFCLPKGFQIMQPLKCLCHLWFDTCFAFTLLPIQQSTYRILWPEISLGALTQKEMPQEKRTESSASIICYLASGYDFMDFHISAPIRHNNPKDLVPDVMESTQKRSNAL